MGFFSTFANPARFMALSRWLAPLLGALAAVFIAAGVGYGWSVPGDYQQGETIKIFFIHIPAAYMAIFCYACLAGASFFGLVFRHSLADAAAKAAAPLGAGFTFLALLTGSLWGRPMWGTWWVWDGRLTSVLVLFLIYLGYMALHAALDDEQKAARAAAILALVGVVNLPIIHFSVEWWNTLHQGSTIFVKGGPKAPKIYLIPMFLVMFGYTFLFGSLWLVRIRAEVWRKRAGALQLAAAR
jgi:heme exporter protein C